jgi:hypothetical protein
MTSTSACLLAGQDGQDANDVQELLSRYDVSTSVIAMADSALHGDSTFGGAW